MRETERRSLEGFCPQAGREDARIYLRPVGLVPAGRAGAEQAPLLGGIRFAFPLAELIVRQGGGIARKIAPIEDILAWSRRCGAAATARVTSLLIALTTARIPFAGVMMHRPRLMGVINVTPDSFSDGGVFEDPARAIARGRALHAAGAELLDIGGESSRPGSQPVPAGEQIRRIIPVITGLAGSGATLSVDTREPEVMRAAIAAGARVVNDISALTHHPESRTVVAEASEVSVVLMHMQGDPATMQHDPLYDDPALDIFDWFEVQVAACKAAGIGPQRIAVDPGIGFGKTTEHNLELLRQAALFHGLGVPVVYGVSRKRMIGAVTGEAEPAARGPGSLAAGFALFDQGVQMLRVHDVRETAQGRAIWEALRPIAASDAAEAN